MTHLDMKLGSTISYLCDFRQITTTPEQQLSCSEDAYGPYLYLKGDLK